MVESHNGPGNTVQKVFCFACLFLLLMADRTCLAQVDVSLPDGFKIERWVESAPPNIYSLCTAGNGSVVVAGPGYFRVFTVPDPAGPPVETAEIKGGFADGAQGMCFHGDDLLAVGNGGLWRFPDALDPGQAKSPQRILPIKTGGEHDAHAIRRGPHGWWYLLAGNGVPVRDEFNQGPNAPVKQPRAGFLMRMSPDFSTREIVAHGFRNAYDFDFNTNGQVFVYDSDGERDISLPWYRPTRVFQLNPGDDAGWVSVGWKRPSHFFDMPREVGAIWRGSPTGVVCYRGSQFPGDYHDAVFVADWTFGRIFVFKRKPDGTYDQGTLFAQPGGQFGFAITDLVIASDGSLIVSVGGRGTEGGLFRIYHPAAEKNELDKPGPSFQLPLPWAVPGPWTTVETGRLIDALGNPQLRLQALQQMVGRAQIPFADRQQKQRFERAIALVASQLEPAERWPFYQLLHAGTIQLAPDDPLPPLTRALMEVATRAGNRIRVQECLQHCLDALDAHPDEAAFVLRLMQLAIGDCDPTGDAAFHGYNSSMTGFDPAPVIDALLTKFDMMDPVARQETGRVIAMLGSRSPHLASWITGQFSDEDPVGDIHWLMVAARSGIPFDRPTADRMANVLISIPTRLAKAGLNTDRNWNPRMVSTVRALIQSGPLADALRQHPEFGKSSQQFLFQAMPNKTKPLVAGRIAEQLNAFPDEASSSQLEVLIKYGAPESIKPVMRRYVSRPSLTNTAILGLCNRPEVADYSHFLTGINSFDANVIKRSAIALLKCSSAPRDRVDVIHVFHAATRLGWDARDTSVRDPLMKLIKEWTGRRFHYEANRPGVDQSSQLNDWRQFLVRNFPSEYGSVFGADSEKSFEERFRAVDWNRGSSWRGGNLFKKLQCAQCHDEGSRLGPRLEGITRRFSKMDLFRAIVFPDEQVPDRYRMRLVETVDGVLVSGTPIYESTDGLTLMEPSGRTVRVNRDDIEQMTRSMKSLMPAGLLDGTSPQEWADLFAYLATH